MDMEYYTAVQMNESQEHEWVSETTLSKVEKKKKQASEDYI